MVKFSLLMNQRMMDSLIQACSSNIPCWHSGANFPLQAWRNALDFNFKSFQIQCPFLTIPSQYRMNAGRVLWSFLCKLRDTLLRSNAATSAFNAFWFNKHRLVPLCCSRCAWRSKVAGHLSQDQITITAKQCFSNRFQLHTNYQHTLTEQLAAS